MASKLTLHDDSNRERTLAGSSLLWFDREFPASFKAFSLTFGAEVRSRSSREAEFYELCDHLKWPFARLLAQERPASPCEDFNAGPPSKGW
jgi:hypothetical protein